MSRVLLALIAWAPMLATAADESRFTYLEQEIRNLQRQVQALSRQVDELTTRPARPGTRPLATPAAAAPDSQRWIDAGKWNALRPGMNELEVLGLLGPPTSMRDENGARVLLYAREIGSTGFLGGNVTLRDRVVVEVRKPTLQ